MPAIIILILIFLIIIIIIITHRLRLSSIDVTLHHSICD